MLSEAKVAELRLLSAYCAAIVSAYSVITEEHEENDQEWALSARNRILAGSGPKADLLGTLSTEPTVVVGDLTKLDLYPSTAEQIIHARDDIRALALALEA